MFRERDRLMELARDFPWVILYYGLPSAGILAVELRRQQRGEQTAVKLPRAETIRNLSVFTSALEWNSRAGDGNSPVCAHAHRALSQILDDLLDEKADNPPAIVPDQDMNAQFPLDQPWPENIANSDSFLDGIIDMNWDLTDWTMSL